MQLKRIIVTLRAKFKDLLHNNSEQFVNQISCLKSKSIKID